MPKLASAVQAFITVKRTSTRRQLTFWLHLDLALCLCFFSVALSACSLFGSSQNPTGNSTTATVALNQIKWCGKALMLFEDRGVTASSTTTAGTPQTVTSWETVTANLGFNAYLPASLPAGTCLVSAQATIHDPIFAAKGSFTIGYLLPNHTALSLSEAPASKQMNFTCIAASGVTATIQTTATTTASPTQTPTQLCSGVKNSTSIIISSSSTVSQLQQLFANLQTNIAWIPTA